MLRKAIRRIKLNFRKSSSDRKGESSYKAHNRQEQKFFKHINFLFKKIKKY